jgi:hypothetical protein
MLPPPENEPDQEHDDDQGDDVCFYIVESCIEETDRVVERIGRMGFDRENDIGI